MRTVFLILNIGNNVCSISQSNIDNVTINNSGEWLAFGSSKLGQLLVWEWQSESYVLKQQGHLDSMNALTYSPDGQKIITAADDGRIKVWDVESGFCIVTFTEHTGGVTACEYSKRGNVLFTASLDGTVRAWDMVRYRNFRTFTAPSRVSFTSMAVDPSGEVVVAGSIDTFKIHIWSVQTGQLLDRLAGHEGPVSSLSFSADGNSLVSGSWDRTVRVWNIFSRAQTSEALQLQSDLLCVAFRPDGKQIAASSLDGQLTFWSVEEAVQEGVVDGRRDVSGGRKLTDRRTAAASAATKAFNTVTYAADGSCVLAAGNSKYICLYDVRSGALCKKFTVSVNTSLDGTQEFLNSRGMTEAGPRAVLDEAGEASDKEDRIDRTLPGVKRDAATRTVRPEVRVAAAAFAPTGLSFAAASTEGLLVYSVENPFIFDPFDLDISITPDSILDTLDAAKRMAARQPATSTGLAALPADQQAAQPSFLKALVMAFRLNESALLRRVYEAIPAADVPLLVRALPTVYLPRLLRFVATATDSTPHLEFNLRWIEALLYVHGRYLKTNAGRFAVELRAVQRVVDEVRDGLKRLADGNVYALEYLLAAPGVGGKGKKGEKGEKEKAAGVNGEARNTNGEDVEMEDDAAADGEGEEGEGEWLGFD